MARKQVIVQLDDKLVADLDKAAKQDGFSGSELLRGTATLFSKRAGSKSSSENSSMPTGAAPRPRPR